jgi:hypothetical protein
MKRTRQENSIVNLICAPMWQIIEKSRVTHSMFSESDVLRLLLTSKKAIRVLEPYIPSYFCPTTDPSGCLYYAPFSKKNGRKIDIPRSLRSFYPKLSQDDILKVDYLHSHWYHGSIPPICR